MNFPSRWEYITLMCIQMVLVNRTKNQMKYDQKHQVLDHEILESKNLGLKRISSHIIGHRIRSQHVCMHILLKWIFYFSEPFAPNFIE